MSRTNARSIFNVSAGRRFQVWPATSGRCRNRRWQCVHQVTQVVEDADGLIHVFHHEGFSDLEFQKLAASSVSSRTDETVETISPRTICGPARLTDIRIRCALATRAVVCFAARKPLTDRDDQAVLLGQGNEAVGGDQPFDRIIPANQGLDTDDPSVGGELRLVVQQELLVLDRPVQPSFECTRSLVRVDSAAE